MNSEEFEAKWNNLESKLESMHEQQQTLMRNQQALAEELGAASEKVDAIAEADGTSQMAVGDGLTDKELIEQLAEQVGADPRSKAEYFGVADD